MWLACQGHRRQHFAAIRLDISSQVRKCATHADKVINHDVLCTGLDDTIKFCLARKPRKAVRPSVGNDIHLNYTVIHIPTQMLSQGISKNFWNGIHPVLLISMSAHKNRLMPRQQRSENGYLSRIKRVSHQINSSDRIACFGRAIVHVLFNG